MVWSPSFPVIAYFGKGEEKLVRTSVCRDVRKKSPTCTEFGLGPMEEVRETRKTERRGVGNEKRN